MEIIGRIEHGNCTMRTECSDQGNPDCLVFPKPKPITINKVRSFRKMILNFETSQLYQNWSEFRNSYSFNFKLGVSGATNKDALYLGNSLIGKRANEEGFWLERIRLRHHRSDKAAPGWRIN